MRQDPCGASCLQKLTILTNVSNCQVEYNLTNYNSGTELSFLEGEEIRLFGKASEGYVFDSEASSTEGEATVVKAEAGTADAEAEIQSVAGVVPALTSLLSVSVKFAGATFTNQLA